MSSTTTTSDRRALREEIAAERRELAEVLEGLRPETWDAPTLCAGWRVREVVAHMTMPFRYSPEKFGLEMAESRGDFTAMSDRVAKRDAAAMSAEELAAALRDNADHPWQPPGGDPASPLTHDVIHGLDFTVPLGLPRRVPAYRLRLVLDTVTSPTGLGHFGVDLTGIRLVADDLEWSLGSGETMSGSAQNLLLAIAGRELAPGAFGGVAAWGPLRRHGDGVGS
jgi:uncharacterized protein (TIGR03083 family)